MYAFSTKTWQIYMGENSYLYLLGFKLNFIYYGVLLSKPPWLGVVIVLFTFSSIDWNIQRYIIYRDEINGF